MWLQSACGSGIVIVPSVWSRVSVYYFPGASLGGNSSSMYDSDDHLQMKKGGCVNYDVTPHIIAHMYLQMRKGSAKVCEV